MKIKNRFTVIITAALLAINISVYAIDGLGIAFPDATTAAISFPSSPGQTVAILFTTNLLMPLSQW